MFFFKHVTPYQNYRISKKKSNLHDDVCPCIAVGFEDYDGKTSALFDTGNRSDTIWDLKDFQKFIKNAKLYQKRTPTYGPGGEIIKNMVQE